MLLADISRHSTWVQAVYRDPLTCQSLRECSSEEYIGQLGTTVGFEGLITPLQLNIVKSHAFHETVRTRRHVDDPRAGCGFEDGWEQQARQEKGCEMINGKRLLKAIGSFPAVRINETRIVQ